MNAAHLHLLVNHLPVFATLFAGMLVAVGVWKNQKMVTDAGLVLAIVAAIGAVVATETGEGAEEIVENIASVTESTIEPHEEAAEAALLATLVFGGLAVLGLALPARMLRARRLATLGALTFSVVAFGLVARAAYLGGMIRHTEISSSSPTGQAGGDSEDAEH